jgi:hypothetical protein
MTKGKVTTLVPPMVVVRSGDFEGLTEEEKSQLVSDIMRKAIMRSKAQEKRSEEEAADDKPKPKAQR